MTNNCSGDNTLLKVDNSHVKKINNKNSNGVHKTYMHLLALHLYSRQSQRSSR